jgi:hypothetical protein
MSLTSDAVATLSRVTTATDGETRARQAASKK